MLHMGLREFGMLQNYATNLQSYITYGLQQMAQLFVMKRSPVQFRQAAPLNIANTSGAYDSRFQRFR